MCFTESRERTVAYKRPTVAEVRRLRRQLTEMRSFYWLDGFRAGRRCVERIEWAAVGGIARMHAENRKLRARIRDLEAQVFVRGHDGTRPLSPGGWMV